MTWRIRHSLYFDKFGGQAARGPPRSRRRCVPRSGRTPPRSCPGRRSARGLHGCVREHASWTCPWGASLPSAPVVNAGAQEVPVTAAPHPGPASGGSHAPWGGTRGVLLLHQGGGGRPGNTPFPRRNSRRLCSPGPGRAGTQMRQSPEVTGATGSWQQEGGGTLLWHFSV